MLLAQKLTVGQIFSTGGITTLVGVAMVFLILAFLIGFVELVRIILMKLTDFIDKLKARKRSAIGSVGNENAPITEASTEAKTASAEINDDVKQAIGEAVNSFAKNSKILSITKVEK